MALDSVEQERIDHIKDLWQRFRWPLIIGVVALIVASSAWFGWRTWQTNQNKVASQVYVQIEKILDATAPADNNANTPVPIDLKQLTPLVQQIQSSHPSSAYAWMAGLRLAKAAYLNNDSALAITQLKFVYDTASDSYRALAALDLMSLYIDQQQYAQALAISDSNYPEAFAVLFADRKGDTYLAQKDFANARKSYQAALDKVGDDKTMQDVLKLKISSLSA